MSADESDEPISAGAHDGAASRTVSGSRCDHRALPRPWSTRLLPFREGIGTGCRIIGAPGAGGRRLVFGTRSHPEGRAYSREKSGDIQSPIAVSDRARFFPPRCSLAGRPYAIATAAESKVSMLRAMVRWLVWDTSPPQEAMAPTISAATRNRGWYSSRAGSGSACGFASCFVRRVLMRQREDTFARPSEVAGHGASVIRGAMYSVYDWGFPCTRASSRLI